MPDQSAERDALLAARAQNPPPSENYVLKSAPVMNGVLRHNGAKAGFNGKTPVSPAAAIASPTAPSASYSQAEAQSMKAAVDAIRVALSNVGLTL